MRGSGGGRPDQLNARPAIAVVAGGAAADMGASKTVGRPGSQIGERVSHEGPASNLNRGRGGRAASEIDDAVEQIVTGRARRRHTGAVAAGQTGTVGGDDDVHRDTGPGVNI